MTIVGLDHVQLAMPRGGEERAQLQEEGRDPATFGKEMVIGRADKTPQEVAKRLDWCREWGCTHAAVDTMGKGLFTADAHLEFLGEVRRHMGI